MNKTLAAVGFGWMIGSVVAVLAYISPMPDALKLFTIVASGVGSTMFMLNRE